MNTKARLLFTAVVSFGLMISIVLAANPPLSLYSIWTDTAWDKAVKNTTVLYAEYDNFSETNATSMMVAIPNQTRHIRDYDQGLLNVAIWGNQKAMAWDDTLKAYPVIPDNMMLEAGLPEGSRKYQLNSIFSLLNDSLISLTNAKLLADTIVDELWDN